MLGYNVSHCTRPGQVSILFFLLRFSSAGPLSHTQLLPVAFILLAYTLPRSVVTSYLETEPLAILAFHLLTNTVWRQQTTGSASREPGQANVGRLLCTHSCEEIWVVHTKLEAFLCIVRY